MEKESVLEQIPPKVWAAAAVGGVIIVALLVWILTSSNSPDEAAPSEDAGTLPSSTLGDVSPDIPAPDNTLASDDLLAAGSLDEDDDNSEFAAYDGAESATEQDAEFGDDADGMMSEDDAAIEAVVTSDDYVNAAVNSKKEPPQSVEVAAQTSASLVDSDSAVRRNFASLSNLPFYKALWRPNDLLQRWVTFTFGLSKGQVMRQVVSLPSPKVSFPVRRVGTRYFLDESGFERYNTYIKTLQSISPATWAENFHYFRPLLEKIFGQMGYDESDFDNTVTKALHEIITANIPTGAMELKAPSAMYIFVDESLENMTPLQKQMVRMGPNNAKVLQDYAKVVRERLLKGGS